MRSMHTLYAVRQGASYITACKTHAHGTHAMLPLHANANNTHESRALQLNSIVTCVPEPVLVTMPHAPCPYRCSASCSGPTPSSPTLPRRMAASACAHCASAPTSSSSMTVWTTPSGELALTTSYHTGSAGPIQESTVRETHRTSALEAQHSPLDSRSYAAHHLITAWLCHSTQA